MLSFHNDITIKEKYLNRIIKHRKADEIEKGYYWEKGKGFAVGCTIHGNDHSKYEIELGIPRILARLEDGIFENLPNDKAKLWPEQFLDSINVGSDLSSVCPKFAVWLLTDKEYGVIKYSKTIKQRIIIQKISDYYADYLNVSIQEWKQIRKYVVTVYTAAYSGDTAAAYANADDATYAAAKEKIRIAQANKLIEILKECK